MKLIVDAARVIADLETLADASGGKFAGAKRLAWTADWQAARAWLREQLDTLPVTVEEDVAGNLWATLEAAEGAPEGFVIVGSHLDAVPSGGWLDGALGVMAALGVLRAAADAAAPPPVQIRLVDWADEEGARFGRSLLASSAVAGTLDPDAVRDLTDADGTRLQDALAECGVDLDAAARNAGAALEGALAYLELHVEQGPVLKDSGRLASVVSGTFGDERFLIDFRGQSAHAGSTPMALRRDTLAAAATAALEIREVGIRHGGVTTVGSIVSEPGVITAIAGASRMMLDLRHLEADSLAAMLAECLQACADAAARFDCEVDSTRIFGATPTPFHPELVAAARQAVADAGGADGDPIPSGPLHDATEIGRLVPTVMLFAQSDPPISHTEIEDSPRAALEVAIEAYGRTVGEALDLAARGALG